MKKALCGLRGAPKYWQEHLVEFLVSLGFARLLTDSAIFVKAGWLIVLVHVDDLIAIGSIEARQEFVKQLLTISR